MSSSSSSTTHIQPRRRAAQRKDGQQQWVPISSSDKGATFSAPRNILSPDTDPIVDFSRLPDRAPTSPESLEALVSATDSLVNGLLPDFDKGFSGLGNKGSKVANGEQLPVPSIFLRNASLKREGDISKSSKKAKSRTSATSSSHDHTSDSGLGESVCESDCDHDDEDHDGSMSKATDPIKSTQPLSRTSVFSPMKKAVGPSRKDNHQLSNIASKILHVIVLEPLLRQEKLQNFFPVIGEAQVAIGENKITCLRDLEKFLIFLAPRKSKSAADYLVFCESSIQRVHLAVSQLSEPDLRRPTDRPYNNTYFVDLIGQVRQYARIMAASRQKQAEGKKLGSSDYTIGEKLVLKGGMTDDGKPAELVREKADGTQIAIKAERKQLPLTRDAATSTSTLDSIMVDDDDVSRSMARKRKCDIGKIEWRACRECGKEFKRPCDLTKHEKTHSRPWKCTIKDCKYFELGWPTEKERDRHLNDKHSSAPALYHCLYDGCTYTSKRESNCKQHMEKAHGWEYVRSKSKNKGIALVAEPIVGTPGNAAAPTPASSSGYGSIATPLTSVAESPAMTLNSVNSPDGLFANSLFFPPAPAVNNDEEIDFSGYGLDPEAHRRASAAVVSPSSSGSPFSHDNSPLSSTAFTADFDFGDMNCNNPWPAVDDFFANQYNLPDSHFQNQTIQQQNQMHQTQLPTPSWSDDLHLTAKEVQNLQPLEFGADANRHHQQNDFMLGQPDPTMRLTPAAETSHEMNIDTSYGTNDFPLFGEQGGSSNLTTSQFSNVGGQFPHDGTFDMKFGGDYNMDHM